MMDTTTANTSLRPRRGEPLPPMLSRRAVLRGSCALVAFAALGTMPVSAQQVTPTPDPTVTTLEREKLVEEVAKLKQETARLRNQNEDPWGDWLQNNAVVVSGAIVALIGVFRWFAERRQDRVKRDEDRQEDRRKRDEDRQEDRVKRDEDRLAAVFDGLGSRDEVARINAAHNLLTFLEPGYERFSTRILYLVVAHLRLQPKSEPTPEEQPKPEPTPQDRQFPRQPEPSSAPLPPFTQALVTVFKEAYRKVRARARPGPVWAQKRLRSDPTRTWLVVRAGSPLDMSDIQLPGAYFVDADLSGVWMPNADLRRAILTATDLTGANLTGADLTRANLREAHLEGADLPEAHLERADLSQANLEVADLNWADLRGAALSGAHLEGAHLVGAILEGAYFSGASLNGASLNGASLEGAHLEGAHLEGVDLRDVTGLTPEQRQMAAEQGAILDEPDPPL